MTTVLIVDDSKFTRGRALAALAPYGYTLVEAADGQAGLTAAETSPPDVVVTDLRMPNLDGIGLLQGLRSRGVQAPVILMAADGAADSCEFGPCMFLPKPFQAQDLAALVQEALSAPV